MVLVQQGWFGAALPPLRLSSGKVNAGQTSHCLNDRLREDCSYVKDGTNGHLAKHVKKVTGTPKLRSCTDIAKNPDT